MAKNKIKNIVFITSSLSTGGAERVISELSNYFDGKGYLVTILVVSSNEVSYKLNPNIKIISLGTVIEERNRLLAMFLRVRSIRQYVKRIDPDIVFSFLSVINIYSCLALGFGKFKLIVSERNDPARDPSSITKRRVRDLVYKLADGFVFQTETAKGYFVKGIQGKSIVIPNPIKPGLPEPYKGVREKRIVAIGRLEVQKNYPLLLKAFADLSKAYTDYTLEIYGEGSHSANLLLLTEKMGLNTKVSFKGVVPNVHERIRNASMFVLTSNYEGMPNALMEAMSIGLPCIASNCPCGGPEALISHGENGLLFPVNDDSALLACMERILEDGEFSEKISRNATAITDLYKISKLGEQWLEFAEKVKQRAYNG